MLTKRKKIVVLVVMFALLVATAILNYTLALGASNNDPGDGGAMTTMTFMERYRSERIATRNEEVAYINELLALEGDEYATQRAEAADLKKQLISITEMESTLENILKAQGYEDAVVTIGLLSDNVNVIIKCGELSEEQYSIETGKIYTLIYEEAQISPDYVRIIPV